MKARHKAAKVKRGGVTSPLQKLLDDAAFKFPVTDTGELLTLENIDEPKSKDRKKSPKQKQLDTTGIPKKTRIAIQQANPKRPGTARHKRYQKYRKAKTVGEFLARGGTKADLKIDIGKGFVSVMND